MADKITTEQKEQLKKLLLPQLEALGDGESMEMPGFRLTRKGDDLEIKRLDGSAADDEE